MSWLWIALGVVWTLAVLGWAMRDERRQERRHDEIMRRARLR